MNDSESLLQVKNGSKLFSFLKGSYHKGNVRMEAEGLTDPELKVPVKYLISIVPIFQNYSQIVEVYGKEGANSIIGNCDTTIFLGGSDSDTLKIIVESTEVLRAYDLEEMRIVDGFEPGYEFG